MVQQVAARSEYQLQLDGRCAARRPQLSILFRANDANGARRQRELLVRADNMRPMSLYVAVESSASCCR